MSFDGTTVALQQTFAYSANLTAHPRQTIVTTTDKIRNQSFVTVYSYSMMGVAAPPDGYSVAGTIPVEQSITYKDFSGAVLKTVAKAWFTATRLGCELTQYGSVISGQWYTYNTVGQLTDEKDYDYGQITALSACNSTSGVPSAPPTGVMPVREKAITYQTFGSSPIFGSPVITNRPSSIIHLWKRDETG